MWGSIKGGVKILKGATDLHCISWLKKSNTLVFPCKQMYDLAKVSENNNHDLSKVSKVTKKQFRIAQNMKTTNIICPKSVKMTSNLVDFEVNPKT